MNTLLGELATLNDINYPRYRIAFKLRKLQKNLLLEHVSVGTVQEALHLSNVWSLQREDEVPVSQLRSSIDELYTLLRLHRPVTDSARLNQAKELCSNWLQMNYHHSSGEKIDAGFLKITLCLLCGSKVADKARYLFGVMANSNGAVELCDIEYFCTVTGQLGDTLQEELYSEWAAPEVWRACLLFVRSAEDIEDDEVDGGTIKRQWLSQFEFCKIFSSLSELPVLKWMALFYQMPSMEKVIHSVRCAICTRKPIVSFRFQCTQCNNFNLCQMCFLKGRVTDKHPENHKMMEFSTSGNGRKSWRQWLLGSGRAQGGRVWNEPKVPFVYSRRASVTSTGNSDQVESPMNAIDDLLTSSQQCSSSNGQQEDRAHKPTMVKIGSGGSIKLSKSPAQKLSKSPAKKLSPPNYKRNSLSTNSSSSPDSSRKVGYHSPQGSYSSSASSDLHGSPPIPRIKEEPSYSHQLPPSVLPLDNAGYRRKGSRRKNGEKFGEKLADINEQLSLEIDKLLEELPEKVEEAAGSRSSSTGNTPNGSVPILRSQHSHSHSTSSPNEDHLHNLREEERVLEDQVSTLAVKRDQLAIELNGLISQVQNLQSRQFTLGQGIHTPSPTSPIGYSFVGPVHHSHSDSLPAEAYYLNTSPPNQSPLDQSPPDYSPPLNQMFYRRDSMPHSRKKHWNNVGRVGTKNRLSMLW